MKKKALLVALCLMFSLSLFAACDHTHTAGSEWKSDATNHWHVCTDCGEVVDSAAHTWNEGEVIEAATCNKEGSMKYTCTVCSATKTEPIEKTAHVVGDWQFDKNNHWQVCENCETVVNKAAHSLTDNGNGQYVCDCGYSEAIPVQPEADEANYVGTWFENCTKESHMDAA